MLFFLCLFFLLYLNLPCVLDQRAFGEPFLHEIINAAFAGKWFSHRWNLERRSVSMTIPTWEMDGCVLLHGYGCAQAGVATRGACSESGGHASVAPPPTGLCTTALPRLQSFSCMDQGNGFGCNSYRHVFAYCRRNWSCVKQQTPLLCIGI